MELVNEIQKRSRTGKRFTKKLVLDFDNYKSPLCNQNLWRIFFPSTELMKHIEWLEAWGRQQLFPTFVIDDDNRRQYGHFVLWLRADERFRCTDPTSGEEREGRLNAGIYLAGNCGSGKSWLMRAMRAYAQSARLALRLGEKLVPISWKPYRAAEIAAAYERDGEAGLAFFKRTTLLCIEDLGSEPREVLHMGTRCNPLAQVLEYRGDNAERCITLITSNIRINDPIISQIYGERVASRLLLMCNYLELKGRDRRREQ